MDPNVTVSSNGVININTDHVVRETGNVFRNFLSVNGNRRKLLIILAIILFFAILKARMKHDNWEKKERERAKIWKEEMKK